MWVAAADTSAVDAALVTAIWAFLGVVVMTLGNFAVQSIRSRKESATSSAQPVNGDGNGTALIQIARDQGVHTQRLDDNDEAIELQDRTLHNHDDRLEALERYNDRRDPDWRSR